MWKESGYMAVLPTSRKTIPYGRDNLRLLSLNINIAPWNHHNVLHLGTNLFHSG